jgi:hypothetical protein
MTADNIAMAFREAATRLKFKFEPRFLVTLPDGSIVRSIERLPHFGSTHGALVFSEKSTPSAASLSTLEEMGYFPSVVFDSYERFDEKHFVDTLDDWGFFGPDVDRPDWCTGSAWGTR